MGVAPVASLMSAVAPVADDRLWVGAECPSSPELGPVLGFRSSLYSVGYLQTTQMFLL